MNTLFGNLPLLQAQPAAGGQLFTTFITFGLVILIFYFLIIRPQNKKQKETQKMLAAIKRGDRVVTIGGIRGTVHSVKEQTVVLKVDENAKIEFSKSAISGVLDQKETKAEKTKTESEPEPEVNANEDGKS